MHGAVLEILLAAFLIPSLQLVRAGGSQGCARGCAGLAEEPCRELSELSPDGAVLAGAAALWR